MLRIGLVVCLVGLAVAGASVTKTREEIEDFRRFLENSRTDDGVRIDSRMMQNPQAKIWENSGKFEGDIILHDEQIEALVENFAGGRSAYIWPNTRWPSNTIIWEFGRNEFTAAQQQAILNAIAMIERNSCVRFRRRSWETNYVLLTGNSDGCYAHVGFWNGRGIHTMNLARNTPGRGCFINTIIIHEWLHVAGFFHMHSTHNRDNYVRINLQNVQSGYAFAFDRYGTNMVSNLNLPYEYISNMHYDTHAFSRNGQPTITALRAFSGVMGQLDFVTATDWLRLRRHYNCPGAWSEEVTAEDMPLIEEPKVVDAEDVPEEIPQQVEQEQQE